MILPKLNIFGFTQAQENAILASLLIGEPCLLIGPPGTAKTELVNAIGAAMRESTKRSFPNDPAKWFDYQVYDASKINFEDLIGYPDVRALQKEQPEVRYIPTKSSIWGKKLIAFDELNRCAEDRQSNLFEIIRSRKLHGIPTGNLFIFSTMNPFGDQGTIQMSDALVDRHLFYIKLDRFQEMKTDERKKVIARVGGVDAVGLRHWTDRTFDLDTTDTGINNKLADIGDELTSILKKAGGLYNDLSNSIQTGVVQVIDKVVEGFAQDFAKEQESVKKECSISGRRAGSVMRGVLAVRAIELATRVDDSPINDMTSTLINTVRLCVPIGIAGKLDPTIVTRANTRLENTIRTTWPLVAQNKNTVDIDKVAMATTTSNPLVILDTLITVNMNEMTRSQIFSSLMDKNKYQDVHGQFQQNTYSTIQALLYVLNQELPEFVPKHIKLDVTPAIIDKTTKSEERHVHSIFKDYTDLIRALLERWKSSTVLYLAFKAAFNRCQDLAVTDADIVRMIIDADQLARTISVKLNAIKEANTANETSSTTTKKKA
jgi:hypothetical protein